MKTSIKKIYISILFLGLLTPALSLAAELSFIADKSTYGLNEDFLVQVFIDTEDVKVNAVGGVVSYPPEFLELKEVRDGNSTVNFWVEKPESHKSGEVSFSGITTGGFSGPQIFLFSLVFHPKKIGSSTIEFNNMEVLENDGSGTKLSTKQNPFSFSITSSAGTPNDLTVLDTNPPEEFNLFISSDPDILDGKYFVVWSAIDKGSGIDHYEVRESFWGLFGGYKVAKSPYLLEDQTLMKKVYIKAIDKNGNERIEKIGAQNSWVWLLQLIILAIILSVCVFSYKKILPKKWRKFSRK